MTDVSLTKARIRAGVWEGVLVASSDENVQPQIEVTHLDRPLDGVEATEDPEMKNLWQLRVPIPPELLSDGVQTFIVRDAKSDTTLDRFSIITGQPMEDDIRAEVDLLRAELDMLKKAFRRHCLEVLG